jgi:hypothetical protein
MGPKGFLSDMPPRQTTPADPSAKLDALDDRIHDLLMQRARSARPSTPAQQARTLRRLAERHEGNLPLPVLVRIWRELMAATATDKRAVHVFAADRAGTFRDLARGLFGSMVAMESHLSASAIVHECSNDATAFGVVPPPESEESARAWWMQLTPSGLEGPRVVATLPLVGEDRPLAYVIGTLEPEPSGDDSSLILLEADETLSLTKLQSLLRQAGLIARLLAVSRDSDRNRSRHHLLEIPGVLREGDPRLEALLEQSGGAILRIASVGSYANALAMAKDVET